ncbi:hypothetical protein ATY41_05755 [Leifsonia xyli subsp. xyli]|uniref:Uncharacterized protein n=1 Tax=Leifsonia xyli subsp. xyli TaxID=59736 RepID=A0A1E2SIA7_LEIXY|nr:hypothetical protein ATY41_05755 [Leifsonia xyli subsp. xyli]
MSIGQGIGDDAVGLLRHVTVAGTQARFYVYHRYTEVACRLNGRIHDVGVSLHDDGIGVVDHELVGEGDRHRSDLIAARANGRLHQRNLRGLQFELLK